MRNPDDCFYHNIKSFKMQIALNWTTKCLKLCVALHLLRIKFLFFKEKKCNISPRMHWAVVLENKPSGLTLAFVSLSFTECLVFSQNNWSVFGLFLSQVTQLPPVSMKYVTIAQTARWKIWALPWRIQRPLRVKGQAHKRPREAVALITNQKAWWRLQQGKLNMFIFTCHCLCFCVRNAKWSQRLVWHIYIFTGID